MAFLDIGDKVDHKGDQKTFSRITDRRRTMGREPAFWLVGVVAVLFQTAATAPSPMYVIYQQRWGFSDTMITVVFCACCLVLLVSMLLFGSLSDTAGRRPVLLVGVGLAALAMVMFAVADGVGWLLAARVVQGFGCGIGSCAATAALIELAPRRQPGLGTLLGSAVPAVGTATGALGAGLLIEHGPAPTVLTYLIVLALLLAGAVFLLFVPETAPQVRAGVVGPRFALAPRRIGVPKSVRRPFAVLALPVIAVWAVVGLYLALGSSLAMELLHRNSGVLSGLVVASLGGCCALAQVSCRALPNRVTLIGGCVLLLPGLGLLAAGITVGSTTLFFAGTAALGLGWGAAYLAAYRLTARLAQPANRGELLAAVNVVAQLGTALPTVGAGVAVSLIGLSATTMVFIYAVGVLVVLALLLPKTAS